MLCTIYAWYCFATQKCTIAYQIASSLVTPATMFLAFRKLITIEIRAQQHKLHFQKSL